MKIGRIQILPPVLVVLVMGVLGVLQTSLQAHPEDAEPFHRRVREAAATLPLEFGNWRGQEHELDIGQRALLRPNVVISRRYQSTVTGQVLDYLLVQCRDARDMMGHYPPNCYPSQGFLLESQTPRNLAVDGLTVPAMEYRFSKMWHGVTTEQTIYDFIILPDGQMMRDMDGVNATAKSYKKQYFGAGQMQLIFQAQMPRDEREAAVHDFIAASRPLIEAMMSGLPGVRH